LKEERLSKMTSLTSEQSNNIIALGSKLVGLGINAKYSHVETGPVVTVYYFELGVSESIRKVMNKAEDFALAMEANKVMVQRVGGKIAVFVPNIERKLVEFKDYLYWYLNDEKVKQQELPIPLGVDYRGNKSTFDLVDMPHCLITGSTGSGKSVFEASIISALSLHRSSSELYLYLVDTKMVDLPLFADLPHVKQVADNLKEFHNMMHYIMQETRRRLSVLQNASCRNIRDYHKLQDGDISSMPYIVLMIDEFGDLIELDSALRKSSEELDDTPTVKAWIKSAAQICRAAGVHLICCTQRASVKVVDGDIKTNLPCRISLRLPTQIDSRTILGVAGAENLLGKGDMLIQRPEKDTLERYHGPYVSMNDIAEIVTQYEFLKNVFIKK
jgi:S-DNA-T family DNA segregation ATPase FtsK/SpoIIIE